MAAPARHTSPPAAINGEPIAIDRACPRCGAAAGQHCVESWVAVKRKTAKITHIARGWLDRNCPTCRATPGSTCQTPSGREASKPHAARWTQR